VRLGVLQGVFRGCEGVVKGYQGVCRGCFRFRNGLGGAEKWTSVSPCLVPQQQREYVVLARGEGRNRANRVIGCMFGTLSDHDDMASALLLWRMMGRHGVMTWRRDDGVYRGDALLQSATCR